MLKKACFKEKEKKSVQKRTIIKKKYTNYKKAIIFGL